MTFRMSPTVRLGLGAALVAISLFIAQRQRRDAGFGRDWTPALESIAAPAGADASAPQLSRSGARIVLSWLEPSNEGTALKFAERTQSGWSASRTAHSGPNLVVNFADVPAVRVLSDGSLAASWLEEDGPDPEAYTLHLAWSRDGGQTWSESTTPHHDGKQAQHGFASLFDAPGAGLGVVWLDGRAMEDSGEMHLQGAIFEPDGSQRSETTIDPRACECCPTAAAATADGIVVAYRDRSAGEVRDIAIVRLVQGLWSEPAIVHADNWEIDACPVNGPAISARDQDVAVAWFTAKDDTGQVFAAFSHDGGRSFGAPVRVDDGSALGRVAVELLPDGSAAVTWIDFSSRRSQIKARRVVESSPAGPSSDVAQATGNQFPRMAAGADELIFAWIENANGGTAVRTARAPLVPGP